MYVDASMLYKRVFPRPAASGGRIESHGLGWKDPRNRCLSRWQRRFERQLPPVEDELTPNSPVDCQTETMKADQNKGSFTIQNSLKCKMRRDSNL